jgi:hypothetical protein
MYYERSRFEKEGDLFNSSPVQAPGFEPFYMKRVIKNILFMPKWSMLAIRKPDIFVRFSNGPIFECPGLA